MLIMQITKRLGSNTPFIISVAGGIIGRDALTNEFKEVYISLFATFLLINCHFFFSFWGKQKVMVLLLLIFFYKSFVEFFFFFFFFLVIYYLNVNVGHVGRYY